VDLQDWKEYGVLDVAVKQKRFFRWGLEGGVIVAECVITCLPGEELSHNLKALVRIQLPCIFFRYVERRVRVCVRWGVHCDGLNKFVVRWVAGQSGG